MAEKVNFTERRLSNLEPEDKLYYVNDTKLPGLVLAVQPTGTKAFQLVRKLNGRTKRVTLGRFPDLSVSDARKRAQQTTAKVIDGVDPIAEKRAARHRGVTVGQAAEHYLSARTLRPSTVLNYRVALKLYLEDWLKRPLNDITRDDIARRHASITKASATQANRAMRFLRAIYNWAREEYLDENNRPLIPDNPVGTISHRRQWNKETRRTDCVRAADLPAWWTAVESEIPVIRDYLRLVLLTGLRRNEATSLRWADVNFEERTLTVRQTKNSYDHTLPISDYLFDLLGKLRQADPRGVYVFPGSGKSGHLEEPKRSTDRIAEKTGIRCTIHGLRRTFITVAESLDIPAYALKRLLNHRTGADVTAGYIVIDTERLREPMQKITNFILKAAGAKPTADVVSIERTKRSEVTR